MVILVYSNQTANSIPGNIGAIDYSYHFVMKWYCSVLRRLGKVVEIETPEKEVDCIHEKCLAEGEACFFLSFTPPFKTHTDFKCPTVSVFAWEYTTIPTESWGGDPKHDWRYVFKQLGCGITHSSFAVRAVKEAMGDDFQVYSIPAPVWDHYSKLRSARKRHIQASQFVLKFHGAILDFRGCANAVPAEMTSQNFIETRSAGPRASDAVSAKLEGIVYTAVFNPNDGRKNWMDLVWGFCWAFRENSDVTLVLKLAYYDYEMVRNMVITELFKLSPFKCRVVALHGFLNRGQFARLIRGTTFIVNTAHGEGQCLPLMEFMSAGKPAIAPDHSAMKDYISSDNAFVVESSAEWFHWPHDPRTAKRTMRYRINWESLYHAYLESYHIAVRDPDRYYKMSMSAVQSLKSYCSQAVIKRRLLDFFYSRGVPEKEVRPSVFNTLRNMAASVRVAFYSGWRKKNLIFRAVRNPYVLFKKIVS